MSAITTHVLDTAAGRPAAGVAVRLEKRTGHAWHPLAAGITDDDGRLRTLLPDDQPFETGEYRIVFATGTYYAARGIESFHPEIAIAFEVRRPEEHFHVPLLVAPHGYTTYRGS
jgi:5-hydroxyisourate hydrolase